MSRIGSGTVAALLLLACRTQAATAVVIEHVNVVDVRVATIYADQSVVLRGSASRRWEERRRRRAPGESMAAVSI